MIFNTCLLLLNFISLVVLFKYEKPVSEKVWRKRCMRNALVLNDCNWCWCNDNFRYTCNARVCGEVDMFGHFNDAIQNINVGMEGHGFWRSTLTVCEPGVHYSRGDLLCVCSEDATWPNPVCRDTFRVLHPVEVIKNFQLSKRQQCSPTKLYLADCNVCFCPSTGRIDPKLCTQEICTDDNLISTKSVETAVDEVYAECNMDQKYKLGCKNCVCLRNNRLLCDNCTKNSECEGRTPGETFKADCNICHCNANGTLFCTLNQCLQSDEETEIMKHSSEPILRKQNNELDCEPGTKFTKNCNTCYCFRKRGKSKRYGCTLKKCYPGDPTQECNVGDIYRKECRTCHCGVYNGQKMEICETDPQCSKRYTREVLKNERKNSHRQNCEAGKVYKNDCSTCECSADGKTLTCTDDLCKPKPESIVIDVIPVALNTPSCQKGLAYKIDCNYCLCLQNGNTICTTMDCNSLNK